MQNKTREKGQTHKEEWFSDEELTATRVLKNRQYDSTKDWQNYSQQEQIVSAVKMLEFCESDAPLSPEELQKSNRRLIIYKVNGRLCKSNEGNASEKRIQDSTKQKAKNKNHPISKERYFQKNKTIKYCYYCKQKGHVIRQCKNKNNFMLAIHSSGIEGQVICTRCNFAGHSEQNCIQAKRCRKCNLLEGHLETQCKFRPFEYDY